MQTLEVEILACHESENPDDTGQAQWIAAM